MTNTRYIGSVNSIQAIDRLKPREGYKVVMITNPDENGKIQLVGPHYHDAPYALSADSICRAGLPQKNHTFENCTCGFYAYTSIEDTARHWQTECGGYANQAIVKVALSQKVVVCEKGYRASHLRVTKIMMPHCWLCPNPGTFMVPHKEGFFVAGCNDCVNKSTILKRVEKKSEFSDVSSIPVVEVESPKKKFWQKNKQSEPVFLAVEPEFDEIRVPVRDESYTFAEFSKKFTLEGFDLMEIASAADLGKEAVAFMEPEFERKQANEWIQKMIEKNDIVGLQKLLSEAQGALDNMINTAIQDIK